MDQSKSIELFKHLNYPRLLVFLNLEVVTVMVTLFIHGKSFSKYYKMIQDQLSIPN